MRGRLTDGTRSPRSVALIGTLGAAGAYTLIRKIGTRASALHSVSYFSLWSTIVASIFMWISGEEFVLPSEARWAILLLLIGIFGFSAQFLAALGLQREEAGRATAAVYLQILFATVLQVTILHVPLQPLSALGSLIILAAAVYVSILK